MQVKHHLLTIAILAITSCSSSDDEVIGEGQPLVIEEGAYTEECRWIYTQMNHYYLWRNDMPDSLACNYAIDPVSFFKSLLSPKDRFSYCERNAFYSGTIALFKDDDELPIGFYTRASNNTVLLDTIYILDTKKVGYFCYLKFEDSAELAPVIRKFKDEQINELIVDLRYNPGGYVSVCKYLCNSIVNENAYGQVFQNQGFNDVLSDELYRKYGVHMESEIYDYPTRIDEHVLGTPLYGLGMNRVYVLTSSYTASASEALIVCLSPYMDVVVIGEQTVGKGVGSSTIRSGKYKYELHPITLRYYNALAESTPDNGIVPDYKIAGGYQTRKKDIGQTEEPLLEMALSLITYDISSENNNH